MYLVEIPQERLNDLYHHPDEHTAPLYLDMILWCNNKFGTSYKLRAPGRFIFQQESHAVEFKLTWL